MKQDKNKDRNKLQWQYNRDKNLYDLIIYASLFI